MRRGHHVFGSARSQVTPLGRGIMEDVAGQADELNDALMLRWEQNLPGRQALGRELLRRYGAVNRVYHDARHLADVLGAVDLLADAAADPLLVELGAWFHDAVYDVRSESNEEASARLAEVSLPAYDFTDGESAEVARLVRLTRDHEVEAADSNGAVLCDADLAVLGGDQAGYDGYAHLVRVEFQHVPEDAFRRGRADVLRRLLKHEPLFRTGRGRELWEAKARGNLSRELEQLAP